MRRTSLILLLAAITVLGACADDGDSAATTTTEPDGDVEEEEESEDVEVTMTDASGVPIGTVELRPGTDDIRVRASLEGLTPGFHGFHVHDVGLCEADAPDGPFTTATGHFVGDGGSHGDHNGDLPSLYVTADGKADSAVTVDAFTVEELLAGDGAAIVVHAGPDNFANIPERYTAAEAEAPGPDEMTTSTGDAGARVACGVIQPAQPS